MLTSLSFSFASRQGRDDENIGIPITGFTLQIHADPPEGIFLAGFIVYHNELLIHALGFYLADIFFLSD